MAVPAIGVSNPRFGDAEVAHYRQHGYVLLPNFFTPDELQAARRDIEAIIPGWLGYADDPTGAKPERWDEPERNRRDLRFPFVGEGLNAATLHPELIRFASIMAGGVPLYCEQADLSFKCRGHYGDVDQQMHMDYPNHTLVYPPDDPAYWQTAYLIYYTDVSAESAPTAVCSWQRYRDEVHWPPVYAREDRAELYEHEVYTVLPAGSVLAYSMRTFHRGTAFKAPGARVGEFVTFAPLEHKWLGIVGWSEQALRREFRTWVAGASPRGTGTFRLPRAR